MKKVLLSIFLISASFADAQLSDGKVPNFTPHTQSSSFVAQPQFLVNFPTTEWADNADVSWYDSTNTTFELSTASQLAGLAQLVYNGNDFSGKSIKLMHDLDLKDHLWMPIGFNYTLPFSGSFDGNHKTIRNVKIYSTGAFVGFFGQFYQASLKNLNLDNAQVFAKDTAGALIGNVSTNSTVDNCHVKNAEVVITGYNGGGFCGGVMTDSIIKNSSVSGSVIGENQIGGFTGTGWDNSKIINCYSEGTVSGDYIIGGFSGFSTMAFGPNRLNTVENSYSRSNVSANEMVGGFYGYAQYNAVLKNVYSAGAVSDVDMSGGFLGRMSHLVVENAYFDKTLAPIEEVGFYDGGNETLDITGKITADMKTQAFKDLLNNGSSPGVWSINPSINDGYPYLNTIHNLSVSDIKQTGGLTIFPTLVESEIHILGSDKLVSYQIVDMSGQLVQGKYSKDQKTINVSSLKKGNYILVMTTEKGKQSEKFIKK